jgi:hypothetical protein
MDVECCTDKIINKPNVGFHCVKLHRANITIWECNVEMLRYLQNDITHVILVFDCDFAETHLELFETFFPFVRRIGKLIIFGNKR